MSLYISSKQLLRDQEETAPVPLLLSSPYLKMQHRLFPSEFEYGNLLQDLYELVNPGGEEEPYFLLPGGCMTMVFQMNARASSCILCGPLTMVRRLRIPPGSTVFCVRLKAGSGDWLADTGASLLTDRAVPLSQYLHGADQLLTNLRRGESFHERGILLCRALAAQDAGTYRPMALLQRCVNLVYESRGLLRVSELASTVGCSERYLNRIFQERIGISTKVFSEITQLRCLRLFRPDPHEPFLPEIHGLHRQRRSIRRQPGHPRRRHLRHSVRDPKTGAPLAAKAVPASRLGLASSSGQEDRRLL